MLCGLKEGGLGRRLLCACSAASSGGAAAHEAAATLNGAVSAWLKVCFSSAHDFTLWLPRSA